MSEFSGLQAFFIDRFLVDTSFFDREEEKLQLQKLFEYTCGLWAVHLCNMIEDNPGQDSDKVEQEIAKLSAQRESLLESIEIENQRLSTIQTLVTDLKERICLEEGIEKCIQDISISFSLDIESLLWMTKEIIHRAIQSELSKKQANILVIIFFQQITEMSNERKLDIDFVSFVHGNFCEQNSLKPLKEVASSGEEYYSEIEKNLRNTDKKAKQILFNIENLQIRLKDVDNNLSLMKKLLEMLTGDVTSFSEPDNEGREGDFGYEFYKERLHKLFKQNVETSRESGETERERMVLQLTKPKEKEDEEEEESEF